MKLLKILLCLLLAVVVLAGGLIGYLSAMEYNPDDVEPVQVTASARNESAAVGRMLDIVTFNTGYGGLGREQDFFMDGGTMVRPDKKSDVERNLSGILGALSRMKADVYFLQEVDLDSYRSYYINQADYYSHGLSMNRAFAYNYKCDLCRSPGRPCAKFKAD